MIERMYASRLIFVYVYRSQRPNLFGVFKLMSECLQVTEHDDVETVHSIELPFGEYFIGQDS